MSDQTELAPLSAEDNLQALVGLGNSEFATTESFDEVVRPGFLGRLSIMNGISELVMDQKMSVGKIALIRAKDDFIDMGADGVVCLPLSWRHTAMRFGDFFVSYHNPKSPEYLQIMEDSKLPKSKCNYGPEFLLWLPKLKEYVTFTFTGTARSQARPLAQLLGDGTVPPKVAVIKSKLNIGKDNKWFGPQILPSSSPIDLPDPTKARAEVQKFKSALEFDASKQQPDPNTPPPPVDERPR